MNSIMLYSLSLAAFGFLGWTIFEKDRLSKRDFIINIITESAIGVTSLLIALLK